MNHLAGETSPYLRQHADNPVDWWPWGDEAFGEARRRDVPVLLSVGYSACHWCHVMAHESFEDPELAAYLNERYVSVKVDREERPDVDALYMEAVQALTGGGGWPMTVWCTPEGRPFYGGTYFPPSDGRGLPSFRRVLDAMDRAWHDRREDVVRQASELSRAVEGRARMPRPTVGSPFSVPAAEEAIGLVGDLGHRLLSGAEELLRESFDRRWGGFGRAPKFPQPSLLELAERLTLVQPEDREVPARHRAGPPVTGPTPLSPVAPAAAGARPPTAGAPTASGGETLGDMVSATLGAMAAGGIWDHLGGGFARYSTDERWLVPHFEKMLYDQAGLLRAYVHAWQLSGDDRWLGIAVEIVEYLAADLLGPDGGLFSAQDADSEGGEGRYYLWRLDELKDVLGKDLHAEATRWWGASEAGNFEGANILHRPWPGALRRPPSISAARAELLRARRLRVPPSLDDKVLTEWNAMAVSSLAEAAMATSRPDWATLATSVAEFLVGNLRRADGRWLRSWQGGRARHLAYAADHAWLVDAFTRLGELSGRASWTALAVQTAEQLIELFWDPLDGGFTTTGSDAERLIVRTKDVYDGAHPSANSEAALALLRLGALTGEERYREIGTTVLANLAEVMGRAPTAAGWALCALDVLRAGPVEIVVTGDRGDLVAALQHRWLPGAVLAWGEPYASPLWQGRPPGAAYVCRRYACEAPASSPEELEQRLAAAGLPAGGPPTDSSGPGGWSA